MRPTGTSDDERRPPGRRWVSLLLEALADALDGTSWTGIAAYGDQHNNELIEVRMDDGRELMIKRSPHEWADARFDASRLAARLLRCSTDVVAPVHIQPPAGVVDRPLEIYWKVALPTLRDLWRDVPRVDRPRLFRDWGALARRVHRVRRPGFGHLRSATAGASLDVFLRHDLAHRLLPAVRGVWPAGCRSVERLLASVGRVAPRAARRGARLVHNDLHMDNVLCRREGGRVRCVGLIDLEAATGAPPESDLASAAVLHGPNFGQPLPDDWLHHLRSGYADRLDPLVARFFRAYHLVNLGFYSALVGRREHASTVARMARAAVDRLDDPVRAHA
ncbi:MAG: phosphotransferase family protein [Gemmatimonadota bacterium]